MKALVCLLGLAVTTCTGTSPGARLLAAQVPESAVGVLVMGDKAMQALREVAKDDPEMQKELATYLDDHLGVDTTKARAMVLYSLGVSDAAGVGLLVALPEVQPLKLPKAGTYEGVDL